MALHKHLYYYDPKALDLAVLQKIALHDSVTDDAYSSPRDVTIHHHKQSETCANKKHEDWKARDTT